ncbi:hypothetical protein BGW80DRAFT_62061 [Lactifluus volemus]|nr:hypothetical protein BGW80DRAFT_62061 [Lactifluus volemus]
MGFLHKFLSLRSKKSKRRAAYETRSLPLSRDSQEWRRLQEEQEEIASRLLRSSSLRYAVVNEVDYSSLPPLPHPINSLRQTSTAPPSRSASIQTRRAYTVTIRDRKVEALTEFPNANPPLDAPTHELADSSHKIWRSDPITPKDQNRLHVLRQDPSVASLLDMYDNQGRLDNKAFSNTPSANEKKSSKDEGAQVKRSGSTLRQLLGNPETSHSSTAEGDISWAEGLLRETRSGSDQSTLSSFRLETPKDVVFGNDAPSSKPDTSLSDNPHSLDLSTNPSTSSMAVELGYTSDENLALASKRATEPELRPAAEVFGFLLEKRRPRNSIPADKEPPLAVCPTRRDFGSSTDQIHAAPATPKAMGASASLNTPSTIGSILFDPPHTATIVNHTRIPVGHGRLTETLRPGQLTATATATRRRIPSSLRNPTRALTSASETYLPSTYLGDPVKPTRAPTSCDGVLRSTTNTTEQTTCLPSKRVLLLLGTGAYRALPQCVIRLEQNSSC